MTSTTNPLWTSILSKPYTPKTDSCSEPDTDTTSIFGTDMKFFVDLAFTKMRPTAPYVASFLVYQELYKTNPDAFIITAPIHQTATDNIPHISIKYSVTRPKMYGSGCYTIQMNYHIYGNIIAFSESVARFKISKITLLTIDGSVTTLAEFV